MVDYSLDSRLLSEVCKQLRDRQTELAEGVLSVQSPDYAGYARKVGEFQGIKKALEIIDAVKAKMS